MNWYDIIGLFGGASAIGTGIWWVVVWRSKKRQEAAKARQDEASADSQIGSNWQTMYNELRQDYRALKEDYRVVNDTVDDIKKTVDTLKRELVDKYAENRRIAFRYCVIEDCPKRNPPLGTFKPDDNGQEADTDRD